MKQEVITEQKRLETQLKKPKDSSLRTSQVETENPNGKASSP